MRERLERTLVDLARRYAPQLVPAQWARPGDYPRTLPELARLLAAHGALPLLGDVPVPHTNEAGVHLKLWVDMYTRIYSVLTTALFPSHSQCSAHYADQDWPPLVVLVGGAAPVLAGIGGYIAPFVAVRQGGQASSEVELRGLVDLLLDHLEAGDLPREQYGRLRSDLVGHVKDLLVLHVRQMPLTPAAPDLFGMSAPPPTLPEDRPPAPPPAAQPPPNVPEVDDVPSKRKPPRGRKPPIPDLPDDKQ
jgi:hypothetical protein